MDPFTNPEDVAVFQAKETSCPVHSAFRCDNCYPGRFTTPRFKVNPTTPSHDPKPRRALIVEDGDEGVYISSDQLLALYKMLIMIFGPSS